jgi:hypothetical protein
VGEGGERGAKDSVKERDKCGSWRGELTAGGGESSPRRPKAEPARALDMTDVPARLRRCVQACVLRWGYGISCPARLGAGGARV